MSIQSFTVPGKLYFKQGSLPIALRELTEVYHAKRVLVVTDEEMLRSGAITPVTTILHELGLTYGVNAQKFDCDCTVFCGSPDTWQYLPQGRCIIIPTRFDSTDVLPWLSADMVILDEDLLGDVQPADILKAAVQSLHGENASDYTLSWAVQAMRLVWESAGSQNLLHAAALAGLAKAVAEPGSADTDLLPDAAEALGMTAEELTNKIDCAAKAVQ